MSGHFVVPCHALAADVLSHLGWTGQEEVTTAVSKASGKEWPDQVDVGVWHVADTYIFRLQVGCCCCRCGAAQWYAGWLGCAAATAATHYMDTGCCWLPFCGVGTLEACNMAAFQASGCGESGPTNAFRRFRSRRLS